MSDFDTALERLVSDPQFRTALATDPARALSGYRLTRDEWDLLRSQVDSGVGGEHQVEQRTSKASLFGLLSPLSGGGIGSGVGDAIHGGGGSDAAGTMGGHTPAAPVYSAPGGQASFGSGTAASSFGSDAAGFGPAAGPGAAGASFATDAGYGPGAGSGGYGPDAGYAGADPYGRGGIGEAFGRSAFGDPEPPPAGPPTPPDLDSVYQPRHGAQEGIGAALGDYAGGPGESHGTLHTGRPPADYHTRVDANGDGRWDQFTAVDRGDRGVDLVVDRDGDGRAEFVGHDFDRDGLIDEATTDTDGDGRLDTRWVDDNGDGWLDRRVPAPPAP